MYMYIHTETPSTFSTPLAISKIESSKVTGWKDASLNPKNGCFPAKINGATASSAFQPLVCARAWLCVFVGPVKVCNVLWCGQSCACVCLRCFVWDLVITIWVVWGLLCIMLGMRMMWPWPWPWPWPLTVTLTLTVNCDRDCGNDCDRDRDPDSDCELWP